MTWKVTCLGSRIRRYKCKVVNHGKPNALIPNDLTLTEMGGIFSHRRFMIGFPTQLHIVLHFKYRPSTFGAQFWHTHTHCCTRPRNGYGLLNGGEMWVHSMQEPLVTYLLGVRVAEIPWIPPIIFPMNIATSGVYSILKPKAYCWLHLPSDLNSDSS